MKGLPYIVFSFLMLCALCSGMNSYRNTENRIAQDVNQALEQVLVKMPNQVITTDTIRCYRSYLTIAELKDTAGIALRTVRRNGRLETRLVAEANCSFASIFMMSDQGGRRRSSWWACCGSWVAGGTQEETNQLWSSPVCPMGDLCIMTTIS